MESFTVLRQVYGRLQALNAVDLTDPKNYRVAVQHNNTLKQYEKYAARFRLIGPKGRPPERKRSIAEVLKDMLGRPPELPTPPASPPASPSTKEVQLDRVTPEPNVTDGYL